MNSAITAVFDILLAPSSASPWLGIALVSFATAVLALLIFRYTSSQRRIRAAKSRITAHLLEVLLYRDDLRVVLRAQSRLALDNLRYLCYALVPLAVMLVPMGIILVQVDLRYGHRPLRVGEQAIVAVQLAPGVDPNALSISAPAGIAVETLSLRMPQQGEVDWRIRAHTAGRHRATIVAGEERLDKEIVVGVDGGRVAPQRVAASLFRQFVHPGEPPLPAGGAVRAISVSYPAAALRLLGRDVHWIWAWLALSMGIGLVLKGPMRVQI